MSREPLSRIEKILSNIVGEGSYELDPPISDAEEILQAILNDFSIDTVARDRICTILLCILNNEEYTGETLSRSEEILKMISQGEKYEVDEWIYEHDFSRVEQLLTDWANKEDPEYIKTVTGTIINVLDAVAKDAISLKVAMEPKQEATPFVGDTTNEPYLSKTATTTGNKRYLDKIVGGTVCWNQLIELSTSAFSVSAQAALSVDSLDNSFSLLSKTNSNVYSKGCLTFLTENHVYIAVYKVKATNPDYYIRVGFKTTGGDYRPAEFIKSIEYNNTTYSDTQYMIQKTNSTYIRFSLGLKTNTPHGDGGYVKDLMLIDITQLFSNAPAIADYIYSLEQSEAGAGVQWLKDHDFIDDNYRAYNAGQLISTRPEGIRYGNTTAMFGSPVELRGLYKLDANNKLYCDGDELTPDGVLKTNYDYRAYQSGDEELTDAITDGTNTVVKKVTPTTASSETYPNPAPISNGDTEAFIDTRSIPLPVGNNSHYAGEYEIEGKTGLTVNHAQTQADTPTTYSISFTSQGTVYGGTMDIVSGELSIEWAEIASYAGETLPGRWLSSLDIYAEGTTPTTGAQVVYELAEPIIYQLSPTQVTMLLGENTLWTEDGEITLTYTGTNPAMMMQSLRVQNNILKKQGLTPIEPLKPLDPVRPILKK